jgi:hypothetical protein
MRGATCCMHAPLTRGLHARQRARVQHLLVCTVCRRTRCSCADMRPALLLPAGPGAHVQQPGGHLPEPVQHGHAGHGAALRHARVPHQHGAHLPALHGGHAREALQGGARRAGRHGGGGGAGRGGRLLRGGCLAPQAVLRCSVPHMRWSCSARRSCLASARCWAYDGSSAATGMQSVLCCNLRPLAPPLPPRFTPSTCTSSVR